MAISFACLPSFAASPGSLDPSFGLAGQAVPINPTTFQQLFSDLAVMDDGRIVLSLRQGNTGDVVTVRCKSDGTLDNTFGNNGIVLTDLGTPNDFGVKVAVQSDGKVVVLGSATGNNITILRYNFNGTLDTTFDIDGKKPLTATNGSGIAIRSDGKIAISSSTSGNFEVTQLNFDGSLDNTFDGDGIVTTNIDGGDQSKGIGLQADGKIVVVGTVASNSKSAIVRYNANGSLDTAFSGDGILINDFFTDASIETLESLAINPINNSISVVGEANESRMQIYRVLANGSFDTSFSGDGRFELGIQSEGDDVVIQSDGKIVVAGSKKIGSNNSLSGILLVRLNVNGTLDSQFGSNGIEHILPESDNVFPKSISLNGDKLVIGNFSGRPNAIVSLLKINLSNTPTATSDFDGDAFADSAVYRPSTGNWFILNSSTNTVTIDQFGANGDIPIDGDFDGDGRCDVAIYRPSQGTWFFKRSSDSTITGATFGGAGDKPIPGDYDKDGKTDMAFFRPGNGNWFVLRSSTNFSTFFAYPFGQAGDIPLTIGGL